MMVLLCGESGTGKSTVAEMMKSLYGARTIGLADPIKSICQDVFGWSHEQLWGSSEERNKPDHRGITPRHALQTLGTDWGRALYENIWVDLAIDRATESERLVVISDGRFTNEIRAVRDVGGRTVRILSTLNGSTPVHASEQVPSLGTGLFTDSLRNDKSLGLDMLRTRVIEMCSGWGLVPED